MSVGLGAISAFALLLGACASQSPAEGLQGYYRLSRTVQGDPSLSLDERGGYRFCMAGVCEAGTYSASLLGPFEGRITFVGQKLEAFADGLLVAGRSPEQIPASIVEPNGFSEANFDRSPSGSEVKIWIEALSETAFVKID